MNSAAKNLVNYQKFVGSEKTAFVRYLIYT